MVKILLISGPLMALAAIVARSFSSHAIYDFLTTRGKLDNFNLAADYLLIHGAALLALALFCISHPEARLYRGGSLILLGSLLFSVTVLIKSCISIAPLGFLTPVGGAILMLGWLVLALQAAISL